MNTTVSDPFGAASDPGLPSLAVALDPEAARHRFKRRLPHLSADGALRLRAIRVTRHKPGRRCVVEYDVEIRKSGAAKQIVTLIGKVRARRSGNEGFRLQQAIWDAGLNARALDEISVPEPIGVISDFQMWFQRKVNGVPAESLLAGPEGVSLARRIAEAIHKLHGSGVEALKRHGIENELEILRDCLGKVASLKPEWSVRLQRVLAHCAKLSSMTPRTPPGGIHRDFYAAQVIVDGSRIWLLDFDLYCLGDRGLDIGNFIGHITEQSLRELGDPQGLIAVEKAMEDRFVELTGEENRPVIKTYSVLTLARHIFLSTRIVERQHLTGALLSLCESRLGIV